MHVDGVALRDALAEALALLAREAERVRLDLEELLVAAAPVVLPRGRVDGVHLRDRHRRFKGVIYNTLFDTI